ncbi:hypothetical protein [Gemmata sp.]|uniref:hypothetical protein n=1 Tax=Gemmata sp. TaxID=1914242 RepID=UPI003F6EC36D
MIAFSSAGEWRLRVLATVAGNEIASPPVTVKVSDRSRKSQQELLDAENELDRCFRSGSLAPSTDLAKAIELGELFGLSEIGLAVREVQLLAALENATAAKARDAIVSDVQKHRVNLQPIAREFFDLQTAAVFLRRKEYDEARKLLEGSPKSEVCDQRQLLLMRLASETRKLARTPSP